MYKRGVLICGQLHIYIFDYSFIVVEFSNRENLTLFILIL